MEGDCKNRIFSILYRKLRRQITKYLALNFMIWSAHKSFNQKHLILCVIDMIHKDYYKILGQNLFCLTSTSSVGVSKISILKEKIGYPPF